MNTFFLSICAVFGLAAAAHIATIHLTPYKFDWLVKAIPVLCLALLAAKFIPGTQGILMVAGFILSAGGDISLSFRTEKHFLIGLVLFLLAHVVYIIAFAQDRPWVTDRWPMIAVLAVFAIGMAAMLFPKLGEMRIPVLIYVSVILTMGVFASIRTGQNAWVLIAGATLFMLSDSVIAMNRFLMPVPGAHYIIMVTYYGGQFLIGRALMQGLG